MDYIKQAFRRVCVQHSKENPPFRQRADSDARRIGIGRSTLSHNDTVDSSVPPMLTVYEAATELAAKEACPESMM